MSRSNTALIAVAGSALVIAAAAASPFFRGKKEKSSGLGEIDEIGDEEEMIKPEDVAKIFDALFVQMQGVLSQLGQQIQQIQMSGQQIPEQQLRQLLKGEFERALTAYQGKVFEENDVDEDCLEEATWEFLANSDKYPQVKKSVERFQRLYESVSGESVVSNNTPVETLTKEKLLEAAEVYFDALTKAMCTVVEKFKEKGSNLHDRAVVQQIQMQFASAANDAGEKALENIGITQDTFKKSVEKHASDPEVGRKLATLQMKQQKELIAMGLPAM